jgi:hypothetical protein
MQMVTLAKCAGHISAPLGDCPLLPRSIRACQPPFCSDPYFIFTK